MRQKLLSVAAALLSVLTAAACKTDGTPEPVVQTVVVYPDMPPTKCARRPAPPALDASDNDWARYKKDRDNAGDDCRDKLDAVDQAVTAWPAAKKPKEN